MRLKRRRTRPRSCGILLVLLLMFGWFCHVLINQVRPAFWALAEIEARARTTEIIARAVTEHITKEPVLVGIERDNQGRVSLVQPNVRMINALSSGTALAIQQDMRQLSDAYIEMPLG